MRIILTRIVMTFSDLRLSEPILKALGNEGYSIPTPIQEQAIPHVLAGRDVLGSAQTGTGKTAAFACPILHRLAANAHPSAHRHVRCLVLCPTRELATQIADSFRTYGKGVDLRYTVIFGGVSQNSQAQALRNGVDVVIATPGRLLDLIQQRCADLRHVETLVLDEADRMLDMGFINDIRKIITHLPAKRQNLLFSATMPKEIRQLADTILHDAVSIQLAPPQATADHIDQCVYFVQRQHKPALLAHLFESLPMSRAIVFTRTKHGADRVVKQLHSFGIRAEAIHGNKKQSLRQRALSNFKDLKTPILVATDIASRGIDVDGVSHVVNYDLTHEPETYIHRIGRTARAGAAGAAVSFCDQDEVPNLKAIERLIKTSITVRTDHPEYSAAKFGKVTISTGPTQHAPRPQAPQPRNEVREHRSESRPKPPAKAHHIGGGVTRSRPAGQHSGPGGQRSNNGGQRSEPRRGSHPAPRSSGGRPQRHGKFQRRDNVGPAARAYA
jgi:ATP-dependent RNA helicase RhlE